MSVIPFRYASSMMFYIILGLDVLAFPLSGWIALEWRKGLPGGIGAGDYVDLMLLSVIGAGAFSVFIYRSWRGGAAWSMLGRVTLMWALTWGLLLVWLVFTKTSAEYSRLWLGTWMVLGLGVLWVERMVIWLVLRNLRRRGTFVRDVILVSDEAFATSMHIRIHSSMWTGFRLVQVIHPSMVSRLEEAVRDFNPDEIWMHVATNDPDSLQRLMEALRHSTANIRLIPDLGSFKLINHGVSVVMGMPMLDLAHSPMDGMNLVVKEIEDRILASVILVLISPVMLAIAVFIKLDSPGPVLFKQRRHGWNGKEIWVYKFRSMKVHEEHGGQVTQATRNDSRITRLGGFLRRSSLDELPQFINVLQGRMSVVGPRPHALAHNHHYKELVQSYMARHKVKPGITGWAQVNGHRGETDTLDKMEARVEHDLYYIENWSLWLDLKIVFLTVFKGFRDQNAY